MEHGQLMTKKNLGENKVITAEQQFLGLILWGFFVFKMAVAITSLRGFAVEAIQISNFFYFHDFELRG